MTYLSLKNPSPQIDKNILISVLVYSLRGYGSERVALNLARGFVEKGLKVDLVIIESGGDFLHLLPMGVRAVELKISDLRSISTFKKIFALKKYLSRENPQVLISIYDTINLAYWAKILAGVSTQIIVDVQNTLSMEFTGIRARVKAVLMKLSYPLVDKIVASSIGVSEDLVDFLGTPLNNIQVIYNPVVTPDIFEKSRELIIHPWFNPGEPSVILGVGRLADQKDFFSLIKAFAIVRKNYQSRLMILGEGPLRSQLEELFMSLA
jgi:glycosyltransferase involved in cell wall biosynthesis